jgi:hypothetical protein
MQNLLPEPERFEQVHTTGGVTLFVMKLENSVVNSAQQISVTLDEQQLCPFHVAL